MGKYYAVKNGRTTGIFDNWKDVQKAVIGYSNANYKGFETKEEAKEWLNKKAVVIDPASKLLAIAYVDGSYDNKHKLYSYGCVIFSEDSTYTLNSVDFSEDSKTRNIAGELTGARKAIEWCLDHDIKNLILYHDYIGIQKWADHEWKCNIPLTENYQKFIDSIRNKVTIQFCKCAAHTGIRYNELADKLAKDAITEYLKKK